MKFQALSRNISKNEVKSSYQVSGNLTIHLTSRFDDKVKIEDVIYEVALKQIHLKEKSTREEKISGGLSD